MAEPSRAQASQWREPSSRKWPYFYAHSFFVSEKPEALLGKTQLRGDETTVALGCLPLPGDPQGFPHPGGSSPPARSSVGPQAWNMLAQRTGTPVRDPPDSLRWPPRPNTLWTSEHGHQGETRLQTTTQRTTGVRTGWQDAEGWRAPSAWCGVAGTDGSELGMTGPQEPRAQGAGQQCGPSGNTPASTVPDAPVARLGGKINTVFQ